MAATGQDKVLSWLRCELSMVSTEVLGRVRTLLVGKDIQLEVSPSAGLL